jgi:uncharacterized protein YbjT (DUF2867 family)
MSHRILVTGATGPVGRAVVEDLLARNVTVRALSRQPDRAARQLPACQVVAGDLNAPATLEAAFASVTALVLIAVPETVEEVVDRARRAGIAHIVVVSSGAVTAGYDTSYHRPVEIAAQRSGLAWSIARPGEFAINALLIWGPSIRQHRRVVEPFPDQVGSPIHERDIAEVVVADLLEPERRGRIDTLIGPDTLSKRQQVAAIAAAIDAAITLQEVSAEAARAFYKQQGGFAAANADFLFGFESYDGVPGAVDQPHDTAAAAGGPYLTITEVLGRPARSYQQWARDHAADFRGPG